MTSQEQVYPIRQNGLHRLCMLNNKTSNSLKILNSFLNPVLCSNINSLVVLMPVGVDENMFLIVVVVVEAVLGVVVVTSMRSLILSVV